MPIYVHSAEVTLTWNGNTESDLAGYRVHCGTSSGNYINSIDVGNETSCTISNLEEGNTYFIAATAYDLDGNESDFSSEVSFTVPESQINNHAPVASNGTLTVTENTTGSGTLSASDVDGDVLTYSIVTNGSGGTATITNVTTGTYTYTPDPDVAGINSFTFKANDGSLDSNEATVTVTIMPTLDTDADGIADDDELNIYRTDPNRTDTDGDGINDGEELALWGNAWNVDYDNDGLINLLDPDADGDGFSDRFEQGRGTDPSNPTSYPSGGNTFGLQLREHKVYAAYTPVYTFTKPTSSTIRCASSGASLGNGYMFVSFPKEEIDGKRLSLRWATSATYYLNPFVARVMDGAYDRTSSSDFPTAAAIPVRGRGSLQIIESLRGSHSIHTVNVTLDLSAAEYSTVTIFIQMNDPWYGEAGYFDIQHLRILDSTDDILWELDLSQTIIMEQTDTIGDYGRLGTVDTGSDSDADSISDADETSVYGTDPNRADTDGDGINDGQELSLWGNNWNVDYDHDGLINLLDPDADGDGFSDQFEQSRGTDPSNPTSYPSGGNTFGLQLREHKVYAAYTPVYTFTKPTSSTIRCASSGASLGNGYLFVSFPKEEIDGKRLSLRWATSATYYLNPFVARVMDGAYDRTSSSDFPTGAAIPYKGKGPLQTIEFLTGSHPAHTVTVTLDLSAAEYSTVTIIIQMNDPWYGEAGYFDIQHLRILDSTDDILWELDLSQTITMEKTGTTGDYGLFGEW